MTDQTVTQLVIDSDVSGAEAYSSAMDNVATAAQKGTSAAADVSLAVAGVAGGVVAAMAAMRGFVDMVGGVTQGFVDIQTHADVAGESVAKFQQSLFAARSSGVSQADFFSGMDKIAADLAQANVGATQFGKLFEENEVSIKNANGQLKTTDQALHDIMDLAQNATPAIAAQVAKIVGLSADWVPFLRAGGDQFDTLQAKAASLGAVIDSSTIQKAKDFNDQWHQAVAVWDAQFKASLASILPLLIQLANVASTVINGIGGVSSFFSGALTSDDQKSKGQLDDSINNAYRLVEKMQALNGDLSGQGMQAFQARNLAGMLGLPEDATIDQAFQLLDKLQKLYDAPTRITVTTPTGDNSTVLPPSGGSDKDALTRATDQVDKRIATMQAEAEAAGQGANALETLRVEAQLYAAAERAGKTDLEQYAEQFAVLAEKAGNAAEALARAKVNTDVKFGTNTAFLSQDDVAIATKLKAIYPDVTDALNSAEASQLRFNAGAKAFSTGVENDLVSGLTDIADGTKTASQGFTDLGAALVKTFDQMVIKLLIVEPLMKSLQATISGSGINLGSLLTPGASLPGTAGSAFYGPVAPSALGNLFDGGSIMRFAAGGIPDIASSPTIAPMAMFGEAGPEAIMPLRRGADGSLGVAAGGGVAANVNVTLIENPNAQGTVSQKSNSNGGVDIEIAVSQIAAKSAAQPGGALNRVMTDAFGARQRVTGR